MTFAIATCEELWSIDHNELLQRRVIHGFLEEHGDEIDADDRADEELIARAEAQLDAARSAIETLERGGARLVASSRSTSAVVDECRIVVTIGGVSIVTSPRDVAADAEALRILAAIPAEARLEHYRRIPILWKRGSASVLLHEAAGHAAEHGHAQLQWPDWLVVHDVPESVDDTGARPNVADLLREPPRAMRRESFTHPALPRMSDVIVQHHSDDFELPAKRIEVRLLGGGLYEPLTETVTLAVAVADLVDGDRVQRLEPFAIEEKRQAIARSLRSARGLTERYPGVICSFEGQELFVGSSAPEVLTVFDA